MVRRLAGAGDGVAVVVGPAGAGKTHALAAAREAWEASGHGVIGAALARRAARELEEGAGIDSTSVAARLERLDRTPAPVLGRRAVVVLDEAAMIPTRELARLVEHAREGNTKLVLLGDDRPLPAIGAGGAFRGDRAGGRPASAQHAPTSRSAPARSFRPTIDITGETTRILVEQSTAIARERLGDLAGRLDARELGDLDAALAMVFGL